MTKYFVLIAIGLLVIVSSLFLSGCYVGDFIEGVELGIVSGVDGKKVLVSKDGTDYEFKIYENGGLDGVYPGMVAYKAKFTCADYIGFVGQNTLYLLTSSSTDYPYLMSMGDVGLQWTEEELTYAKDVKEKTVVNTEHDSITNNSISIAVLTDRIRELEEKLSECENSKQEQESSWDPENRW